MEYLKSFKTIPIMAGNKEEVFTILEQGNYKNKRIDVVLIDLKTATIDGFQLATEIRNKKEFIDLPKIIMASAGSLGDGNKCKDIGIDAYLLKPVKRDELKIAISKALDQSHSELKEDNRLITRHTIAEEQSNSTRILLVEDYPTNQKVAMKHLSQSGHHVTLAENGKIAVALFKKKHFDLILMDIQMPVMDGYTATLLIRDYEAKLSEIKVNDSVNNVPSHIPIIAMTAHAFEGYKEKCLKADMDDFITKPIRKEKFLLMIKNWLPQTKRALDTIPMDYKKALDEFDNDKEFLNEVIDEFLNTVKKQLIEMGHAIVSENSEILKKEAHAIKGGAANLTASSLSAAAHELEKIAESKDFSNSLTAFKILKNKVGHLKDYFEKVS